MKEAKLYIFDMDGTILDSMPYWLHLGRDYLTAHNIPIPDNLEQQIESMTLEESAVYFQRLGLQQKTDDIIQGVLTCIADAYRLSIPAKPGMLSFLRQLHNEENTICLLTTSEKDCAVAALTRLGVIDCFDQIFTSSMLQMGKNNGDIYKEVCKQYHIAPSDSVVFEDAGYAVRSAKEAGCYVYAVYDEASDAEWDSIVSQADEVLSLSGF